VGAKQQLERLVISRVPSSRTKCKCVCLIANTHLLWAKLDFGYRSEQRPSAPDRRMSSAKTRGELKLVLATERGSPQPKLGSRGHFRYIHLICARLPARLPLPPPLARSESIHLKELRLVSLHSQRSRPRLHRHDCAYLQAAFSRSTSSVPGTNISACPYATSRSLCTPNPAGDFRTRISDPHLPCPVPPVLRGRLEQPGGGVS
jgi:hypothetical protein